MVKLSLEKLNSTVPYQLEHTKDDGFYEFITDSGVRYNIGFELTEGLLSAETYQFMIVNVDHKKSPRDPKLRNTIIALLEEFFSSFNSVILYICETGDDRQRMRHRLFEQWYRTSKFRGNYAVNTATVTDSEGIINYATIILRTDHPKLSEIIAEFSETARMLDKDTE